MKLVEQMTVLFFAAIIISIVLYYYQGGTEYIKAIAQGASGVAESLTRFPSTYPR